MDEFGQLVDFNQHAISRVLITQGRIPLRFIRRDQVTQKRLLR